MQVHVDTSRCQGHALCAMTAPELFDLNDDDGHATAVVGTVSTELEAEARTAEAGCPERAAIITAAGSDSS